VLAVLGLGKSEVVVQPDDAKNRTLKNRCLLVIVGSASGRFFL